MAISKIMDKPPSSERSLKNAVNYILRDGELPQKNCAVIGPYPYFEISTENVLAAYKTEREIWGKLKPNYAQGFVISFHEEEHHTVDELLEFGEEFCRTYLKGHQCVIAVHEDTPHMHIHIIENAVSYLTGKKEEIHRDKCRAKAELIDDMCRRRGWHVDEKGKHYDGTEIEPGTVAMCNTAKFNVIKKGAEKCFLDDCVQKVMLLIDLCESKEEFIAKMGKCGWKVSWEDSWKPLLFEDEKGHKVGSNKLGRTFNLDLRKETIEYELSRNKTERINDANIEGRVSEKTEGDRCPEETDGRGPKNDIESSIGDFEIAIANARDENEFVRNAETESRIAYRERHSEERQRAEVEERAREAKRRKHRAYEPEL